MYLLRQAGNKNGILGQSVLIPQADVSKKAGRIFLKQTEELSLCSDSGRKDGNTMKNCCNCSEPTSKMLRISSVWRIRQIKFQKQA